MRLRPVAGTWRSSHTIGEPASAVNIASGAACAATSSARYCGWIAPPLPTVARLSSLAVALACSFASRRGSRSRGAASGAASAPAGWRRRRRRRRRRRGGGGRDGRRRCRSARCVALLGIELPPGEIAAEQQQRVAGHQRVIAALGAEHAGHADRIGIVVFEEILGAGGEGDRRLQPLGERDRLRRARSGSRSRRRWRSSCRR